MKYLKISIAVFLLIFLVDTSGYSQAGSDLTIDQKVDSVLGQMTIDEKIGQMTLFTSGWTVTGPTLREDYEKDLRAGRVGNLFNAHGVEYNSRLQKIALEETRMGIPLLFGYDVIHGFKTIYPIPLALACTWDMDLIEKTARFSAKEATAAGLNWTYNPMVDIARDPRWGRIAKGAGEDPFLGSRIAEAKVRGYQGTDLGDSSTIAACVKHFAGYGAAEAGRDYNTVDMSELRLRQNYLPPFHAAIDAGCASIMTSFNELFGVPATGNEFLFQQILRNEWNFKGVVVTDYTAINEMVAHGYARDLKQAGELALKAGIDMDMQGAVYLDYLEKSLDEGKVTKAEINQAVRRILRLKFQLGLFEDPYRYLDKEREKEIVLSKELSDHALDAGKRSIVLLKNEAIDGERLLPLLDVRGSVALIGPLADNGIDVLGSWHAARDSSQTVTVAQGIKNKFPDMDLKTIRGCGFEDGDTSEIKDAINLAAGSDLVILAVGENYQQNGEAASRSDINLPGPQMEMVKRIVATGKPVIALVMAGRPLTLEWLDEHVPAILNTWHLGSRTGDAIAEVLDGDYNPSGKLVITFPQNVGQIPIYYNHKNTGRPFDAQNKYTSKYLDVSNEPLYPFGYGLSYTTFEYSGLTLSSKSFNEADSLIVTVDIANTGKYDGEEVVQLYIHDRVGSVTRPVKELKGFEKIFIKKGESKKFRFTIRAEDLAFYNDKMEYNWEPGEFDVYVGGDSRDVLSAEFELTID